MNVVNGRSVLRSRQSRFQFAKFAAARRKIGSSDSQKLSILQSAWRKTGLGDRFAGPAPLTVWSHRSCLARPPGPSRPLGATPANAIQCAAGETLMQSHGPCTLKGPITQHREWWQRPSRQPRKKKTGVVSGIRFELVQRIRREI